MPIEVPCLLVCQGKQVPCSLVCQGKQVPCSLVCQGKQTHSAQLARIRVVLVGTTLARNIGASARAMKVMGLRRLYLVNPKSFPDADATALAAGAEDVLEAAVVCTSLSEAIGDCTLIMGTSARRRDIFLPELSPARAASMCVSMASASAEVALVFGSERIGLLNSELALCQSRIQIPTDPDYSSLNLASAVQLIAYELRLALLSQMDQFGGAANAQGEPAAALPTRDVVLVEPTTHIPAPAIEFDRLMQHYAEFLKQINFYSTKNPEKLLTRLRRIFQRAAPDQREIQILRGILSEAQGALARKGTPERDARNQTQA
jgi:tRNA (cytidine32/uridine32-2'-O)-methyltransferase